MTDASFALLALPAIAAEQIDLCCPKNCAKRSDAARLA